MRNPTLIAHALIAIATATLFLFQMAELAVSMSALFVYDREEEM
jgi:hypothetical protein